MSEIVLSNTTTCSNQYIPAEYSNPDSIMSTGAFDSMVEQQKMDSPSATAAFDDGSQQQQQQQPFYQGKLLYNQLIDCCNYHIMITIIPFFFSTPLPSIYPSPLLVGYILCHYILILHCLLPIN